MSLTREEVLKVAKLARLEFKDEEIQKFQIQLNDILGYVDILDEVDTEGVEPLIQINEGVGKLREDEVRSSFTAEEALRNAPQSEGGTVIVPKVVGE
ncbi:Asp-tRNA(Asn)/Glu-tRNA(Gln) amidotransferase subunit GatC [uncultured Ilyobacter sp.]|uniref:Asp-tRNA(Asn)/Glu-tRNA(Gln) amidotransferase subunit GatC n=1 Tax=uncultured Ilyobacter sp. TaxID=544433 RepID=UPI0029C75D2F|nr:Asp-tRNA(Asn)/Glu-tRNA(Gln) amidotransferase subunit GatC [uncultured Ilyobacter sp.]